MGHNPERGYPARLAPKQDAAWKAALQRNQSEQGHVPGDANAMNKEKLVFLGSALCFLLVTALFFQQEPSFLRPGHPVCMAVSPEKLPPGIPVPVPIPGLGQRNPFCLKGSGVEEKKQRVAGQIATVDAPINGDGPRSHMDQGSEARVYPSLERFAPAEYVGVVMTKNTRQGLIRTGVKGFVIRVGIGDFVAECVVSKIESQAIHLKQKNGYTWILRGATHSLSR